MTFIDLVTAWLAGVAPIPLILFIIGFGKLIHFISKKLKLPPSRFDDPRF